MRISVSGSFWTTCIRILSDYLRKISASRSCPTTCIKILFKLRCGTTCARSLYQDPVGPLLSGSCTTTSARSLSQDLCVRILLDHLHQDLVNEQILPFSKTEDVDFQKGASKTSVLRETSSKTEVSDFQNERFARDFLEN